MKFLLATLITIFFCNNTFAGLLIDPYLGYKRGDMEYTIANYAPPYDGYNGHTKHKTSGFAYGARVGYIYSILMAGLSYELGTTKSKFESTTLTASEIDTLTDKYDTTRTGVFLGLSLPIIRVWGTYYIDAKWEGVQGDDRDDRWDADGYGLGIGFTGLPFISLNLEYHSFSVNSMSEPYEAATAIPSINIPKFDIKEFMISISLPLDI